MTFAQTLEVLQGVAAILAATAKARADEIARTAEPPSRQVVAAELLALLRVRVTAELAE